MSHTQEVVYERLKKAGGATPFNMFMLSEVDCMFRLIAAVRETLTVSIYSPSLSPKKVYYGQGLCPESQILLCTKLVHSCNLLPAIEVGIPFVYI